MLYVKLQNERTYKINFMDELISGFSTKNTCTAFIKVTLP